MTEQNNNGQPPTNGSMRANEMETYTPASMPPPHPSAQYQQFQQPQPIFMVPPSPNYTTRLIIHLVLLFVIEPIVLGIIVWATAFTLILLPASLFICLVWLGLITWHIIAIILALIGMSKESDRQAFIRFHDNGGRWQ